MREHLTGYRCVDTIASAVLDVWPDHERFLRSSFETASHDLMSHLDEVAELTLVLMGEGIREFASAYRWMCEQFRDEQLYFARHKRYRLTTLREAQEKVYGDSAYMSRYVKGILVSQTCWSNHAKAMDLFRTTFLPCNKDGYEHLEVGHGHGLFLAFAARDPRCKSLTGWDLSPSSLQSTRIALDKMQLNRIVNLAARDVVEDDSARQTFDSIICSEVLEHTEDPGRALRSMLASLRPAGRVFLNVPVNSPAPDHIYLWRETADLRQLIADTGFLIDSFIELPPTGKTLDLARKYTLDISCIVVAHKS